MLHLQLLFRIRIRRRTRLITTQSMRWFRKVGNKCLILKVLKIVWCKVRRRRSCYCKINLFQVQIQLSHILGVAALELSKCSKLAMRFKRSHCLLIIRAVRCQDQATVIAKNSLNSPLKTSNSQREENQQVELLQRIRFQRIKVI